jgi:hypothetical protein
MPFPLNCVVLSALAEADFLAVLALTGSSASLYHYILEHVINASDLLCFLRKNQYALHHDSNFRLFSQEEIILLLRAFNTLQRRHGNEFYDKSVGLLGPLLGCTPMSVFEKPLPSDYSCPLPPDRKGRIRGSYSLESIRWHYSIRLKKSWMHSPTYYADNGQAGDVVKIPDFKSSDHLKEDFLFCKRYIEDFNKYFRLSCDLERPSWKEHEDTVLTAVTTIRKTSAENGVHPLIEKRCLQGLVKVGLSPRFENWEYIPTASPQVFLTLFNLPGWLEMWTPSELGWWFGFGLTQWPDTTKELIKMNFETKSDALIWLFLGAHHWFHSTDPSRFDSDGSDNFCCTNESYGCERKFIVELISSILPNDRIWAIQKIIRRAPEFGVCRELGANIFNYFVIHDLTQADKVFSTLLNEMCGSRLQYIFEYAISLAIAEYLRVNTTIPFKLDTSRKYADKLLRKDLELYSLLTGSERTETR